MERVRKQSDPAARARVAHRPLRRQQKASSGGVIAADELRRTSTTNDTSSRRIRVLCAQFSETGEVAKLGGDRPSQLVEVKISAEGQGRGG